MAVGFRHANKAQAPSSEEVMTGREAARKKAKVRICCQEAAIKNNGKYRDEEFNSKKPLIHLYRRRMINRLGGDKTDDFNN